MLHYHAGGQKQRIRAISWGVLPLMLSLPTWSSAPLLLEQIIGVRLKPAAGTLSRPLKRAPQFHWGKTTVRITCTGERQIRLLFRTLWVIIFLLYRHTAFTRAVFAVHGAADNKNPTTLRQ